MYSSQPVQSCYQASLIVSVQAQLHCLQQLLILCPEQPPLMTCQFSNLFSLIPCLDQPLHGVPPWRMSFFSILHSRRVVAQASTLVLARGQRSTSRACSQPVWHLSIPFCPFQPLERKMGDTPFPSLTMEKEPCDNRRERHRRKIDLLFLKLQKVLLQAPETRRRKVLEKACTALLSMKASESLRGTCNKGT